MARITQKSKVEFRISFDVDEEEARALDAMAGYGDDEFVIAFYEKLGASYMRDHERGLRRFLSSIRSIVGGELYKFDEVRTILNQQNRDKKARLAEETLSVR